ncbi:hypothetical protein BDV98DRAFT_601461 [Pterulicium gracile]|uniref:Transmembrane protein n=1 Tax=Pterulicium gracile TaxID=1884261 RepID=A0A5C3QSR0_9AGAR|nr:hypothetical protein BDV98DRAFT_601461 [Pterula gracilis]
MKSSQTAIVDDQDSRIGWSGPWDSRHDPSFGQYNGSYHWSGDPSHANADAGPSRATFKFYGSSLSVFTSIPIGVTAVTTSTCQLDSLPPIEAMRIQPINTVDLLFQPVCQFLDIANPEREHEVVIERIGGGPLILDYLTYTPTRSGEMEMELFVDDAEVGYEGMWAQDVLHGALQGTRHSSDEDGARATFPFRGTNVQVYATHPHENGPSTSRYYIDDVEIRTYTSPTNLSRHQLVFDSEQLEDGDHVLTIEVVEGPVPLDYILFRSNTIQVEELDATRATTPGNSTLSTGAIVGISVASTVIMAVLLVLFVCLVRRKRRYTRSAVEDSTISPNILNPAGMQQSSTKSQLFNAQLGNNSHPSFPTREEALPAYSEVFPLPSHLPRAAS